MARTKKKVEEVVETPVEEVVETEETPVEEAPVEGTPVEGTPVEEVETEELVNVEIPEEEREPIIRIRYVPGITSVDCHYVEQALENANCPYEAFNINDFKDMAREDGVKWMFAVLIKDEVITNYRTALAKLREYGKI